MLLRGFLSRSSGEKEWIWYFLRGHQPKEPSLLNVGAEEYFYGKRDDGGVDDQITKEEQRIAPLLRKLRAANVIEPEDFAMIAGVVLHFASRTRHVRYFLAELGKNLSAASVEIFTSQGGFERVVKNYVLKDPAYLERLLKPKLQKINPRLQGETLRKVIHELLIEITRQLPTLKQQWPNMVAELSNLFLNELPTMTRNAHIQGLGLMLEGDRTRIDERIAAYQTFKWSILNVESGPFVLGDVGPIAWSRKRQRYIPAAFDAEDQDAVIMPISTLRALVGTREDSLHPEFSLNSLNEATVALSWESYFASEKSPATESLFPLIGIGARQWYEEELRDVKAEMNQDLIQ